MTSPEQTNQHGRGVATDKPQRGIKDGYMELYYRTHDKMAQVIADSAGAPDHRIRSLTLYMISMFPDDNIRVKTFEYYQKRIADITKDIADVEERNQAIADFCCGEMCGHITSHFDMYMGITHRIVIGSV